MGHNLMTAACTVYVWEPKGFMWGAFGGDGTRVGHSSIRISDGNGAFVYMSFWPADHPDQLPTAPSLSPDRAKAHMATMHPAGARLANWVISNVVDGDNDHEQGRPTKKFRFTAGLNWGAMINAAHQKKSECRTYDIWKKNCCHAVANVLAAGNPPVAVPLTGYIHNTWHPSDIISYCRTLVTELNRLHPGSAAEKDGGAWI